MAIRHRRPARIVAGLLLAAVLLAYLWPLHALASRLHPLVLGMPFSIAWVVLGQLGVFAALLLLFFTDETGGARDGG